jgi:molybdate transport system permease protein
MLSCTPIKKLSINPLDISPLLLSLKLAIITTFLLLLIGIPLAYGLAFSRYKAKILIQTLVTLPLILPPSVLGFYLLIMFNPQSLIGSFAEHWLGIRLIFSFEGLVMGSVIYSLPFMVNPIQSGFEQLPDSLREASYTLGKSRLQTLFWVLLPNMQHSIWTGVIMSFAHTIGEFGVVLMIGGNIPQETSVVSIAIYNEVEMLNYKNAHQYSLVLLSICFVILFLLNMFHQKNKGSSY